MIGSHSAVAAPQLWLQGGSNRGPDLDRERQTRAEKHPWWPISPPAKREHFPLDILCVYTRFSKISSHRRHLRTFPFSVCLLSPAFSITPFSTKIICPLAGSLSFVFSTLAPRGCVWLTQGQLSSFQARWIAAGCRGNKQPTNFFCLYFLFIYLFFLLIVLGWKAHTKWGAEGLRNGNRKEGRFAQWPCLEVQTGDQKFRRI